MSDVARDLYAAEGLRYLPQILTMLDQNPISATYGCGDRQYWLYKSIDYPGGMYGEFALPLALVYRHEFPDNPYFGKERIRDLALAVIRHQARSGHNDGSNDDFYPNERAMGSTAFTLYAMAEAVHVLEAREDDLLAFLARRANWLAKARETGRLSNHHALGALGLAAVHRLTGEAALKQASEAIRDRVLSWQSIEGWFPEYDGCDPGYHAFTISFLAYLRRITGDDTLTEPLARAVGLAADLVGPDGSYGGEIGSRNSYHFLPHGFELLAPEIGEARYVADRFLAALRGGNRSYLDDNRTFCHYLYNYLQSWLDYAPRADCPGWTPAPGTRHLPEAGLVRVRRGALHAVISTRKGGVVKASTATGPLASDTGLVMVNGGGRIYAPVGTGAPTITEGEGESVIEIANRFERVPNTIVPSTPKFLALRLANLTVGRLSPNLLRKAIQYLLINRRIGFPVVGIRRIRITDDRITVEDSLVRQDSATRIAKLAQSTDLTTIYTASSNAWHASRFFPWRDLGPEVEEFNRTGELRTTRVWPEASE